MAPATVTSPVHASVPVLAPAPPAPAPPASDPLRVLVVSESFLPQVNGVTGSVRRVLEHLSATGHHAEVVAPTGPASYAGFPVTCCRSARLPRYADFRVGLETRRRLRTVIERVRPDVVHLASPAALGLAAAGAAADLGVPVVAVYQTDLVGFARQYGVPGGARAMASLTRRVHRLADRTLAPSRASLTQLDGLGVPRVALWPRGVDLEGFHPSRRDEGWRRTLAPDGRLLVGYVGRLAVEKELALLTHLAHDPRLRLVLVGCGPEEERLRRLLPGAHFTGLLTGEALGRAHAGLDVFVHTGRHETFGQAAQEAQASGVPVVAPRAGGMLDVVDDGRTGLLFPPGDGAAMAAAVDHLLTHDLDRRRLGRAARTRVRDRSWRAVGQALLEHYREVLSARRGGPAARLDRAAA